MYAKIQIAIYMKINMHSGNACKAIWHKRDATFDVTLFPNENRKSSNTIIVHL